METAVKNKRRKREDGGPEPVFRRVDLGTADVRAIQHVEQKYRQASFVEAVRLCLHQQVLRDRVEGCPGFPTPSKSEDHVALLIGGRPDQSEYRELVSGLVVQKNRGGTRGEFPSVQVNDAEEVRELLFRFWKDDEEALARVMKGWGFEQYVDAVRFCVRVQALLSGFRRPSSGTW